MWSELSWGEFVMGCVVLRHYELVSKFNVGLKTLLHQGLSEPEFYSELLYKLKNKMYVVLIFLISSKQLCDSLHA